MNPFWKPAVVEHIKKRARESAEDLHANTLKFRGIDLAEELKPKEETNLRGRSNGRSRFC